jgi:hypothetical protein
MEQVNPQSPQACTSDVGDAPEPVTPASATSISVCADGRYSNGKPQGDTRKRRRRESIESAEAALSVVGEACECGGCGDMVSATLVHGVAPA